ncbi:MAG: hypothetical protein RMM58_00855 [Chloroflexota bacterium]|nr:hypothetical protein [Dehalococcoidia bacterium]MDW8252408.1 hypothetical protein [Chloroflexota bacterium]
MMARLGATLLVVGVALVQLAVATAGTFRLLDDREFRWTTGFLGQQADAFAHGQLALRTLPPTALAALANPYDPDQRFPYNPMLDAVYYAGRYYLYFGPAPAALLALAAPFADVRDVPDAALALPFALGLTLATGGALLQLRRLLPGTPPLFLVAAYLVAGLAYPLPALLSRPAVYETAILAGGCFLMTGLVCAGRALRAPWWWPAAGAAWALAAASRLSLAPAVLLLGSGTILWLLRRRQPRAALGVGLPLAGGALALGWYNWARFGSVVETGVRFQFAGFDLVARYDQFFGLAYLLPNLVLFLFAPPALLERFPFLTAMPPGRSLGPLVLPAELRAEPVVGLLVATPFALLAPLGLAALWRQREQFGRALAAAAGLAALAGAAILPVLLQRYVTARYLGDIAPLAVLVAFLGAAALRAGARHPRLVDAAVGALAGVSVGIGILLGVNGRYEVLARQNPALFAALGGVSPTRTLGDTGIVFSPLDARFGDALALGGFRFEPETPRVGEQTTLVLWWRPLEQPRDLTGRVRLVASGFRPVTERAVLFPAAGPVLAASEWREQRVALDLPLDSPAPGYLFAELTLRDDAGPVGETVRIGPLRVRKDGPWPPEGAERRDLRFGNDLVLAGIRVERYPDDLGIYLYWRASWSGGLRWHDREVTVELIDSGGRIVSRTSGDPGDGWYRTSFWQPGDRILDERDVPLPAGLPPGEYAVRLAVRGPGGDIPPMGDPVVARLRLP